MPDGLEKFRTEVQPSLVYVIHKTIVAIVGNFVKKTLDSEMTVSNNGN